MTATIYAYFDTHDNYHLIFNVHFYCKADYSLTGKFVVADTPQYFKAARSYALAAFSSLSYPPALQSIK